MHQILKSARKRDHDKAGKEQVDKLSSFCIRENFVNLLRAAPFFFEKVVSSHPKDKPPCSYYGTFVKNFNETCLCKGFCILILLHYISSTFRTVMVPHVYVSVYVACMHMHVHNQYTNESEEQHSINGCITANFNFILYCFSILL